MFDFKVVFLALFMFVYYFIAKVLRTTLNCCVIPIELNVGLGFLKMASEEVNMDEFLCFKGKAPDDNFFNRERTLRLLELYKLYKKKVGTFQVKSIKKLWELVSRDISNEYHITILPSKCENRFKVLERNYKKIIDNNNKTGRGRKVFEFEEEMDEIFEKKKNVNPALLLSSQQNIKAIPDSDLMISCSDSAKDINSIEEEQNVGEISDNPTPKANKSLKRKRIASPAYQKRNDILLDMKNDLKQFYERRDQREAEKICIATKKLEEKQKRTEIARKYLEFIKQKGTGASEPDN